MNRFPKQQQVSWWGAECIVTESDHCLVYLTSGMLVGWVDRQMDGQKMNRYVDG